VNLLPLEQRRTSSRLRYVPTLTLAALALLMLGAVVAYPKYADRHYLGLLHQEIRKLDPEAKKAADLDRQIALTRNRTQTLDNFRRHTKEDMDALNELTQMLAAPTWLNSLQLTRDSVTIAGETEQAAALIKLLDSSKQFRNSSFALPLQRSAAGELFSIRSSRREPSQ
jgi:general secretion pathway protein L